MKDETSIKQNGEREIANGTTKAKGSAMQNQVALRQQNSASEDTEGNRLEVLKSSSEILRGGVSDSMIYADNAMSELQSQMQGMFGDQPEPSVRRYDPDRVATAAGCARTIADLIRAKTEAMRLLIDEA